MPEIPERTDEHKFDTLSLLAGLDENDAESFSLEDILREFGSPHEPAEELKQPSGDADFISSIQMAIDKEMEMTVSVPDPVIEIESAPHSSPKPEKQENEPQSEADALLKRHGLKLIRRNRPDEPVRLLPEEKTGDPEPQNKPSEPEQSTRPNEPEEEQTQQQMPALAVTVNEIEDQPETKEEHARKQKLKKNSIRLLAGPALPTAEYLAHTSYKELKNGRRNLALAIVFAAVSLVFTAMYQYGLSDSAYISNISTISYILLGSLLCCAFFSRKALAQGFSDLFRLKFSGAGQIVLSLLMVVVACIFAKNGKKLAPAAVVCIDCVFAQWRYVLNRAGIRRSIKPILKNQEELRSVSSVEDGYEEGTVAVKTAYSEAEHVQGLLSKDIGEKTMETYSILAVIASLAFAVILKAKTGTDFLWSLSLMLSASVPIGCFICFSRPFAGFARVLGAKECAISGWTGAKEIHDSGYLAITDTDLFPPGQVKLGGVKLYYANGMGQVSGNAEAVMEAAGCGLTHLFEELRDNNNGRVMHVSQFRRYEGGGFGAQIGGDIVLLGSQRFMQLMGINMINEAKIPGAIYMSTNGILSAVFVIHYLPSGKTGKAIRTLVERRMMTPLIATGDFLLTPRVLEELFHIQNEALEFPDAESRNRIATLPGALPHKHCLCMRNHAFPVMMKTVFSAETLYLKATTAALIASLLSAALLVVLFAAILLSQTAVVNPFSVGLVLLATSIPGLLITSTEKK